MLLQSLLLVATLVIIGSTLLTTTLVSAKAKFHAAIVETGRSAMTDATADFIAWTQSNIRNNGIDQLAEWAAKPQTTGRQPACGGAANAPIVTASSDCKFFETIEWNVTGFTDASDQFKPTDLGSEATNLATAQNEHRISATVNLSITDNTGSIIYSHQARELTARIFHALPYVVLTGERDASSENGSIKSAEGDTGGYLNQLTRPAISSNVQLNEPAAFTDTGLTTTIDCVNTLAETAPVLRDGSSPGFTALRAYGNLAWSHEAPCRQETPLNPNTAPPGYAPPRDGNYGNGSTKNDSWKKGDDTNSSFAP